MRHSLLVGAVMTLTTSTVAAQSFGPEPDAKTRAELLSLREGAWRAYFANDAKAFRRIVPDELVAIGWSGGEWSDAATTLEHMKVFASSGKKLSLLEFPSNVFQLYGDVAILYTRFKIVLTASDGSSQTVRGRGTEVFVKRKGRWIHTGWHLDSVTDEKAPASE